MGFFKEEESIDLGQISIENIFINDFMPSANGTYVKVYLLGYKYANDSLDITNRKIARHLNISQEDVINAWKYWENKNVVKIHEKETENAFDFDVEFLSLRQLYITSNFSQIKKNTTQKSDEAFDKRVKLATDDSFKKMFKEIGYIMHRPLEPKERMDLIDLIEKYNVGLEVVVKAFDLAVNKNNVKSLKYVYTIIKNWSDAGVVSINDLHKYKEETSERYQTYRKIYKILGYNLDTIAEAHENLIDHWLDDFEINPNFLFEVLKEITKKTSNANMNYINKIIETVHEKNITTMEKFKNQKPNTKSTYKSYAKKKNDFHNFEYRGNKYSEEELEKILGIKD